MKDDLPRAASGPDTELAELLARRIAVQEWIARLDAQRGAASERVVERVRADYEKRLQETLEALGRHEAALRQALDSASSSLNAAGEDHLAALEALEETRLRHLIGEVDDTDWDLQRKRLEKAVDAARSNEREKQAESDRLRELLAHLEEREPEPAIPEPVPARAAVAIHEPPTPIETPRQETFLLDIDRALGGADDDLLPDEEDILAEASLQPDPDVESDVESDEGTAPRPGLKCGECGYTNDLSAWYCGVCGADIG